MQALFTYTNDLSQQNGAFKFEVRDCVHFVCGLADSAEMGPEDRVRNAVLGLKELSS